MFEFDAEKTCGHCEGEGGWEVEAPRGWYEEPVGEWRKCSRCDGKGTITVHVRPVDMEDLASIHGDDDPYSAFAYRGGNP